MSEKDADVLEPQPQSAKRQKRKGIWKLDSDEPAQESDSKEKEEKDDDDGETEAERNARHRHSSLAISIDHMIPELDRAFQEFTDVLEADREIARDHSRTPEAEFAFQMQQMILRHLANRKDLPQPDIRRESGHERFGLRVLGDIPELKTVLKGYWKSPFNFSTFSLINIDNDKLVTPWMSYLDTKSLLQTMPTTAAGLRAKMKEIASTRWKRERVDRYRNVFESLSKWISDCATSVSPLIMHNDYLDPNNYDEYKNVYWPFDFASACARAAGPDRTLLIVTNENAKNYYQRVNVSNLYYLGVTKDDKQHVVLSPNAQKHAETFLCDLAATHLDFRFGLLHSLTTMVDVQKLKDKFMARSQERKANFPKWAIPADEAKLRAGWHDEKKESVVEVFILIPQNHGKNSKAIAKVINRLLEFVGKQVRMKWKVGLLFRSRNTFGVTDHNKELEFKDGVKFDFFSQPAPITHHNKEQFDRFTFYPADSRVPLLQFNIELPNDSVMRYSRLDPSGKYSRYPRLIHDKDSLAALPILFDNCGPNLLIVNVEPELINSKLPDQFVHGVNHHGKVVYAPGRRWRLSQKGDSSATVLEVLANDIIKFIAERLQLGTPKLASGGPDLFADEEMEKETERKIPTVGIQFIWKEKHDDQPQVIRAVRMTHDDGGFEIEYEPVVPVGHFGKDNTQKITGKSWEEAKTIQVLDRAEAKEGVVFRLLNFDEKKRNSLKEQLRFFRVVDVVDNRFGDPTTVNYVSWPTEGIRQHQIYLDEWKKQAVVLTTEAERDAAEGQYNEVSLNTTIMPNPKDPKRGVLFRRFFDNQIMVVTEVKYAPYPDLRDYQYRFEPLVFPVEIRPDVHIENNEDWNPSRVVPTPPFKNGTVFRWFLNDVSERYYSGREKYYQVAELDTKRPKEFAVSYHEWPSGAEHLSSCSLDYLKRNFIPLPEESMKLALANTKLLDLKEKEEELAAQQQRVREQRENTLSMPQGNDDDDDAVLDPTFGHTRRDYMNLTSSKLARRTNAAGTPSLNPTPAPAPKGSDIHPLVRALPEVGTIFKWPNRNGQQVMFVTHMYGPTDAAYASRFRYESLIIGTDEAPVTYIAAQIAWLTDDSIEVLQRPALVVGTVFRMVRSADANNQYYMVGSLEDEKTIRYVAWPEGKSAPGGEMKRDEWKARAVPIPSNLTGQASADYYERHPRDEVVHPTSAGGRMRKSKGGKHCYNVHRTTLTGDCCCPDSVISVKCCCPHVGSLFVWGARHGDQILTISEIKPVYPNNFQFVYEPVVSSIYFKMGQFGTELDWLNDSTIIIISRPKLVEGVVFRWLLPKQDKVVYYRVTKINTKEQFPVHYENWPDNSISGGVAAVTEKQWHAQAVPLPAPAVTIVYAKYLEQFPQRQQQQQQPVDEMKLLALAAGGGGQGQKQRVQATTTVVVVCAACSASGPTKACSLCLAVKYCNRDCQLKHWPSHKTSCKRM